MNTFPSITNASLSTLYDYFEILQNFKHVPYFNLVLFLNPVSHFLYIVTLHAKFPLRPTESVSFISVLTKPLSLRVYQSAKPGIGRSSIYSLSFLNIVNLCLNYRLRMYETLNVKQC
jgi:hypothetical protein